jgi:chromosome segregation ATPase
MMIRESALRPLRENVEAVGAQIVALSSRADSADASLDELRKTVAGLVASVNAQAETIELQEKQIARLQDEAEVREENVKQLRAWLIRIERQGTSDLEEMRSTTAALAHQLLVASSSARRTHPDQPSTLTDR